jgi:hypothetical protein
MDRQVGTWVVLMRQYTVQQLPRARELLERVENGERLGDSSIAFLKDACAQSRETLVLLERHPQYLSIFTRPVSLYAEVIALALSNERGALESGEGIDR